jgi:class 3 adenylate cyclase
MERRLAAILAVDAVGYSRLIEQDEASTATLRAYRVNCYGTGVNVAARLQQLAEPGGICISQTVFDQVRKIVEIPFQDMANADAHCRRWPAP